MFFCLEKKIKWTRLFIKGLFVNTAFNPRMQNPIPCRVFEKTHLRMDLSQSTSKHGFEAKITQICEFFFSKKKHSKVHIFPYESIRRIQQKIMLFYYMRGWFYIYFFNVFQESQEQRKLFYAKDNAKLLKNSHKIFI